MQRKKARYERLLRVRHLYEDARSHSHLQAKRSVDEAVSDRLRIREQRRAVLEQVRPETSGTVRAQHAQALYHYERYLAKAETRAEDVILSRRRQLSEKRRELESAYRQRRIAERLVERVDEHMDEHRRKTEQRMIDELSSMRRRRIVVREES
jgi:flagellar export protein FliJ